MWTPFDLFLDARVTALDGVLSRSDQSIFLELFFWICAYLVYGATVSEKLRSAWSKTTYWNSGLKDKIGVFCGNAQDDIILMNMLGMHHICAGGLALLGALSGDPNLFRHGCFIELGFECADVLSMNPIFPMFPYRHDNVKLDAYVALLAHHIPTVIMGILSFQYDLVLNHHAHQITIWALLGAALSAFGAIFVETRNVKTQLGQATASLVLNALFWYYCRFHVFKREAYAMYDALDNDPDTMMGCTKGTPCADFLPKFFIVLTVFNSIVLLDASARSVRYMMRMFNGTTVLEWGSAPPSREDRYKLQAKAKAL